MVSIDNILNRASTPRVITITAINDMIKVNVLTTLKKPKDSAMPPLIALSFPAKKEFTTTKGKDATMPNRRRITTIETMPSPKRTPIKIGGNQLIKNDVTFNAQKYRASTISFTSYESSLST